MQEEVDRPGVGGEGVGDHLSQRIGPRVDEPAHDERCSVDRLGEIGEPTNLVEEGGRDVAHLDVRDEQALLLDEAGRTLGAHEVAEVLDEPLAQDGIDRDAEAHRQDLAEDIAVALGDGLQILGALVVEEAPEVQHAHDLLVVVGGGRGEDVTVQQVHGKLTGQHQPAGRLGFDPGPEGTDRGAVSAGSAHGLAVAPGAGG